MEYDVFNKYPDYLQDFEEIQILSQWQWSVILGYLSAISSMLDDLKVIITGGDYWEEIVKLPAGANIREAIRSFHSRYEVTTLDVLRSYVAAWMSNDDFTLEYDKDTMTLTLSVSKSHYDSVLTYKRIRDVVPCNMELIINLT